MSAAAPLAAASAIAGVFALWDAVPGIDAWRERTFALWVAGPGAGAPDDRRLARVGAVAAGAAGVLLSGLVAGLLLAAVAPAVAKAVRRAREQRSRRALAAGVPLAARSLADALGAGHAVTGALAVAESGVPGPAGRRLAAAADAVAVGAPVEAALEAMRKEGDDPAWDSLVSAILLQRTIGGDLPALLRTLAAAAEASSRSEAAARATLAQAMATARLIGALPAVVAVLIELLGPGTFASVLGEPVPLALLVVSAALGLLAAALLTSLARSAGR